MQAMYCNVPVHTVTATLVQLELRYTYIEKTFRARSRLIDPFLGALFFLGGNPLFYVVSRESTFRMVTLSFGRNKVTWKLTVDVDTNLFCTHLGARLNHSENCGHGKVFLSMNSSRSRNAPRA